MNELYKVNPELDIPLYQQLVDTIRNAVKKGELVPGEQLPTVQEMTAELNIARGTIKRAYDELERGGFIEKVQGRGTFVRYQPENSGSRKEQAVAAIDKLLNELESMGLSAAEINIFLTLKLRERAEEEAHVKVAVVECNPESMTQLSEQLRHISGVDLYSYLLDTIREYPYQLSDDFDLIVTTPSHATYLESVLPVKKKIVRIAVRPSPRYLSHVIKLRPETRVGIVGHSRRFCELMYETCQTYNEDIRLCDPLSAVSESNVGNYLSDKDVLLVPKAYEKYVSTQTAEMIRRFKGEVIDCHYDMDEGSMIYLETKIKRLLEEKTL